MKKFSPAIAYLTVGAGMLIFHNAWAALLSYHAGMILILLAARPSIPMATPFKGKGFWPASGTILLYGSGGTALYLLWPRFDVIPNLSSNLAAIGLTPAMWPLFIAYFTLINPWLEEYFWRGYLGSVSRKLEANDIIFAGFHGIVLWGRVNAAWVLFALCVLTLAGWLWRQVARQSRGLLVNSLAHMAADFSILFAIYKRTV